jgi:hypothetical protein
VGVVVPTNVLIFPANVTTGSGGQDTSGGGTALTPAQRNVQQVVTESFRRYFSHAGIGVVVYSHFLPSVERAVSEGAIKPDEANAGPNDDGRVALRFANLVGALEYVTIDVTDYKYDAIARTVNFNVSVQRCTTEGATDTGTPLALVAKPAIGTATADLPVYRQERAAVDNAARAVADETFQDLYPQIAQMVAGHEARMNSHK